MNTTTHRHFTLTDHEVPTLSSMLESYYDQDGYWQDDADEGRHNTLKSCRVIHGIADKVQFMVENDVMPDREDLESICSQLKALSSGIASRIQEYELEAKLTNSDQKGTPNTTKEPTIAVTPSLLFRVLGLLCTIEAYIHNRGACLIKRADHNHGLVWALWNELTKTLNGNHDDDAP